MAKISTCEFIRRLMNILVMTVAKITAIALIAISILSYTLGSEVQFHSNYNVKEAPKNIWDKIYKGFNVVKQVKNFMG